MAKRPATIIHVAEKARVSVKTVSRVLNNEPNVTPDLKARVLEAVDKLGYSPSKAARTMAGSRSYLLVAFNDRRLTLDNWRSERGNEWIDQMLYGAMLRCEQSGYHLMFELVDRESDQLERQITAVLSSLQPDGVILTPPNCENPVVLGALKKRKYPVRASEHAGAGAGTAGLHGRPRRGPPGDQAPAGPGPHADRHDRRRLQVLVLDPAGRDLPGDHGRGGPCPCRTSGSTRATSRSRPGWRGRTLLDLPEPPTAIMASNDQMALGVVSVAQARGLTVPGDLSILSYDDTIGVRLSVPSLTAVRQPVAKMAEKAADMLITASAAGEKQIAGSTLVPFELMVRASTGPAPK
jgi:LacI family transcriptional regulator